MILRNDDLELFYCGRGKTIAAISYISAEFLTSIVETVKVYKNSETDPSENPNEIFGRGKESEFMKLVGVPDMTKKRKVKCQA